MFRHPFHGLRNLFGFIGGGGERKPRRRNNLRLPLNLEQLEDRFTPSTITVTTSSDAVSHVGTSLRDAIATANTDAAAGTSDTIDFDSSLDGDTITLAQGQLELSGAGAGTITVDGAGEITINGDYDSGIFQVDSGVNGVISGLTLTDGFAYGANGGGINNGGNLTVSSCFFNSNDSNNSSGGGGGIYNSGTLAVEDCEFAGGFSYYGAGLDNAGTASISDSLFGPYDSVSANSAEDGGAGVYNSGTLTISGSTLSDNPVGAGGVGGGIDNTGVLTVTGCTISGNSAPDGGGSIHNTATATVANSTITGNTGDGSIDNSGLLTLSGCAIAGNTGLIAAGGIMNSTNGKATVSNSTIFGNVYGGSGFAYGGGIWNLGTMTVANSTISGNTANGIYGGDGGGILDGGTLTLLNTIVAGNSANSAGPDVDQTGTVAAISANNLIGNGSGLSGITNGSNGNQVGTSGSPIDPLLGTLQNNGGPTDTMALGSGSPAIGYGGAITTMSADAGTSDTTIYVANAAAIASTPGDYYIMIDGEEMEVTAVDLGTNALTVTRAINSVSAAPDSGDPVYFFSDQRGVSRSWSSDIGAWGSDPVVSLTSPGSQSNADSDTIWLSLTATDSASNALTFSATGLPSGLSINSSTGDISGTISGSADTGSPYSVTVTATDADDASASANQTFSWAVSSSGTITVSLTAPSNQTNHEEDSPTLSLSATDSASNALIYGASNLPPGLAIDPATGVIYGTVDDFDSSSGPYTVTVNATDSTNPSVGAYQTFTWNVHPLVRLVAPSSETNADGDTVYLPLAATDSAGNALNWSVTAGALPTGLSLNASTGLISGTISGGADADSPYSVTVTATDSVDSDGTDSQAIDWTVNPTGGIQVTLTAIATQTNYEQDDPTLSPSGTDSADNSLVWNVTGLPAGLSFNSSTGVISGTVDNGDSVDSPYTVTVAVSDSDNSDDGASRTFTWVVHPLVTLNVPSAQTNADGDTVYLPLSAADSASNPLNWSVTAGALPAGLSLNASTGLISGTISAGADADSPYSVTVAATDSVDSDGIASQTIDWTVNPTGGIQVTLAAITNQTNYEQDNPTLSPSATDSADNSLVWNVTGLPAGLTFSSSTGVISGTVDDGDSMYSPYTVTVAVSDSDNSDDGASRTFTWVVHPLLSLSAPSSETNADGDTVYLPLSATDSAGNPLTWSVTAGALPPGLSLNSTTGLISGTISADADSPYSVTVTATDSVDSDGTASQTIDWTVNPTGDIQVTLAAIANQTNYEQDDPTLSPSATDSADNSLVWNVTGLPAGLTFSSSTGVISGTIDAGDSLNSSYMVTVSATDSTDSDVGACQTFAWIVDPLVTQSAPSSETNADGDTVYLPLSATDSAGSSLNWSVSAGTLPSGLSLNATTGLISGTISDGADADSPYSVTITTSDYFDSDGTASQTIDWTVNPTGGIQVALAAISTQTNYDQDEPTVSPSATDSADNSLVWNVTGLPAGLSFSWSTGAISGTIDAGDSLNSPYIVTVSASDSSNSDVGGSQTFTWIVHPLVTVSVPSSETIADGDTVYLPLSATDSAGNPLNWSVSAGTLPTGLSLNATTGLISGTIGAGADADSPYSVTITATDSVDSDGTASQSIDWTVNPTGTITVSLTAVATQEDLEGDAVDLPVVASDSASNALEYTAVGLPLGLTINASTGVISGTVDTGDSLNVPYSVSISATDSTNSTVGASESFEWFVSTSAVDPAPARIELTLPNAQATVTINGNAVVTNGATATFITIPLEAAATYTVRVTYQADGYTAIDQRQVQVTPGNTTQVNFTEAGPPLQVSALIQVTLPAANATVTLNGRPIVGAGTQRTYTIPAVASGSDYVNQLSVSWTSANGNPETFSMNVTTTPGATTSVNLSAPPVAVGGIIRVQDWAPPVRYQAPWPYPSYGYMQQRPVIQGSVPVPVPTVPLNIQGTASTYAYMYFDNQWNVVQQGQGGMIELVPRPGIPGTRWIPVPVRPQNFPHVPPLPTVYMYLGKFYNYYGPGVEGGLGIRWGINIP